MKEKMGDELTVPVASSIPKTLHSRDSAERLVRMVVGLWRGRAGGHNSPAALILDFSGISQLSESAAGVLVEFRFEFSGGGCPQVEFSNTAAPVRKALTTAEKSLERLHKRIDAHRKKKSGFMIEI